MARTLTATEAKARILTLLDDVAAGEEIAITKHGRVVARLVGASGPISSRGELSEVAATADEEDDLLRTGAEWDAS